MDYIISVCTDFTSKKMIMETTTTIIIKKKTHKIKQIKGTLYVSDISVLKVHLRILIMMY